MIVPGGGPLSTRRAASKARMALPSSTGFSRPAVRYIVSPSGTSTSLAPPTDIEKTETVQDPATDGISNREPASKTSENPMQIGGEKLPST